MPWTKAAGVLSWESAGSATNDGGVGMLQALGYDFLDKEGRQVPYGAQGLEILKPFLIKCASRAGRLPFYIACDVTNMLCGDLGCSAVYGPQKGATPEMIVQMDQWLERYAALARQAFPESRSKAAGNGSGRRPRICISLIYKCSAGIRD